MEVVNDICEALELRCAFSETMFVLMMAGMMHSFAFQTIPARRRRHSNAVGRFITHRTFVGLLRRVAAPGRTPPASTTWCRAAGLLAIGRSTGPRNLLPSPVEPLIDGRINKLEALLFWLVKIRCRNKP
ncbi:MAG: hypothetical protein JNM08_15820 [Rubrivivax sp.]|nr:hypothetical protein [Rubrivivax sp.]